MLFNNHRSNLGPVASLRLYAQPAAESTAARSRAALQPGTYRDRPALETEQLLPGKSDVTRPGGKNNTAAGTCHGGWRPEGGCTDLDVAVGGENEGNNGETVQREAKLTRDTGSRPLQNRPQ